MYRVSGNWDQIEKYSDLNEIFWDNEEGKSANRVYALFNNFDRAREIYNLMQDRGMVAFRNWLE